VPAWYGSILFLDQAQQIAVSAPWEATIITSAVVLRCGADETDATDIDLLDDLRVTSATGHCGLEGVEVHDDQVDGRYVVFLQLRHITVQVAPAEYAAEDFRVQRLDAATEDAGVGRQVFHGDHRDAEPFDEGLRATGGVEVHPGAVQFTDDRFQTILVVNGDQRIPDALVALLHALFAVQVYAAHVPCRGSIRGCYPKVTNSVSHENRACSAPEQLLRT
jgi:hypothetical protein